MAQASYLYTSLLEGHSANLGSLAATNGLLKFTTTGSVATAAVAVASTNVADNDYVGGSAKLSNIASLTPGLGDLLVGTGDGGFWDLLVSGPLSGSVFVTLNSGPTALPAWLEPGTLNQVLAVTSVVDGHATLGWVTPGAGVGSVTSVAVSSSDLTVGGSPITTAGTITLALNTVGIAKGGTGQTTKTAAFDALSPSTTLGDLILYNGTNNVRLPIGGAGRVLTSNGTTAAWTVPSTSGTVTSVAATSTDLTIGGSPITTAGTLTFTLNTVVPTKGGTGLTTYTTGDMLYSSATNVLSKRAIGTSGQVLTVSGGLPVWATPATSGTVTSVATSTTTGILLTGSPITASGTLGINLPGSGGASAVVQGDILVGGAGAAYAALAKGAANTVMVSNGTTAIWAGGTATSGQALTYNGTNVVWASLPGTGTVTSVALASAVGTPITYSGSPITGAGTITLTLGTVLTSNGGTGLTTFTAGDTVYYASGTALTKVAIGAANTVMTSSGTAPQWVGGTASSGQVLTYNGSAVVWAAPATVGTVTSVGASSASGIIVAGSPITSSGTITFNLPGTGLSSAVVAGDLMLGGAGSYAGLAIGTSGKVLTSNGTTASWADPATSGTVTSVAASSSDITIGGSPITTAGTITLSLNTVVATKGGTGQTTYTTGDTLYASASNTISKLGIGTEGQVMKVVSGIPAWATDTTTGTVTSVGVSSSDLTVGGSPITSSGTITLSLNTVGIAKGGTGQVTALAAFNALSPLTTTGDLLLFTGGNNTRLAIGGNGTVLTSNGTTAAWAAPATSGTVTSVGVSSASGIIVASSPVTTSGTITVNLPGTGTASAVVAGDLLLGGAGSYAGLAIGTSGKILTSNGTTATWASAPSAATPWTAVTGTSQTLAITHGYIATNVGLTTFTLPATAAVGDTFYVVASTAAGWSIVGGDVGQQIRFGNQLSTANTGNVASQAIGDSVTMVCIDATTPGSEIFCIINAVGNLTIN